MHQNLLKACYKLLGFLDLGIEQARMEIDSYTPGLMRMVKKLRVGRFEIWILGRRVLPGNS